jgi:hypothetical protein
VKAPVRIVPAGWVANQRQDAAHPCSRRRDKERFGFGTQQDRRPVDGGWWLEESPQWAFWFFYE